MDTRDRIIAEARVLFAERGYEGATTAELAKRAGIAEGTIYRHFRNKDELFVSCVESLFHRIGREEATGVRDGTSLRTVVRTLLQSRVRLVSENLDLFDILFSEACHHPDLLRSAFERAVRVEAEQVAPALRKFADLGQVRHLSDITEFVLGITAAIWAVLRFRTWLGESKGIALEELVDFVLYGIAGSP